MEHSTRMVRMKQTLAQQQQQLASQRTQVQRQQALALMCRYESLNNLKKLKSFHDEIKKAKLNIVESWTCFQMHSDIMRRTKFLADKI